MIVLSSVSLFLVAFSSIPSIVPSSSSLIGGYGIHTTLNASIHFATSCVCVLIQRGSQACCYRWVPIDGRDAIPIPYPSQVCCYGPHVYCASSTAKNKDKMPLRMCMDCLQMVRHIYQKSQVCCYGPHVYCTVKTRTNAIAHAYGRICRCWDTYLQPQ